ncbi:hypothetical protein J2Z65_003069 [Paenibacillus aceris]|uniref:Uncharacterized protein n=1 Tax=Paenibacillus aceris TaxID=869555 RepID=A0ABS4HZ72_9BACL|nr:hypothetical protein [Paenibacillus aceris]
MGIRNYRALILIPKSLNKRCYRLYIHLFHRFHSNISFVRFHQKLSSLDLRQKRSSIETSTLINKLAIYEAKFAWHEDLT